MRKNAYRSIDVKEIRISPLAARLAAGPVWIGLDVGKREVFAVVRDSAESFQRPWRIRQPDQIRLFVSHLEELRKTHPIGLAMESTGTYGDPLRQALTDAGFEVRRVNGKATQDYAEIFDGVCSAHDGKDAGIIAELAALGKSQPWASPSPSAEEAELETQVDWLTGQQEILQIWQGKLHALLSRHWPELPNLLDLTTGTLVHLLAHYGDPVLLAADEEGAKRLAKWGGSMLKPHKIEQVLESARTTTGVRMNGPQAELIRQIADQILKGRAEIQKARERMTRLVKQNPTLQRMAGFLGVATACVLYSTVGDPRDYHCGAAYRKAIGLNLKEHSSGQYQGKLRISKRGPSQARKWLYFAALRLVQHPSVCEWFERKKSRDQGRGVCAVVAVMRKLVMAIYAVTARDQEFCVERLFPGALPPSPRDLSPENRSRRVVLEEEAAKG